MLGQNPLKILSITPPRKAYSLLVESRNGISIVIDSQLIVATMMEKLIFPLIYYPYYSDPLWQNKLLSRG